MQTRAAKQRLQTGRPTMSFHQSSTAEQQHPKVFTVSMFSMDSIPLPLNTFCISTNGNSNMDLKVPLAPQVKHSEMQKLLEATAEKISGLVRNKRRSVLAQLDSHGHMLTAPSGLFYTPTPCATSMATLKCRVAKFFSMKLLRCAQILNERFVITCASWLRLIYRLSQVELAGKHLIVNASERKMNVKFSRHDFSCFFISCPLHFSLIFLTSLHVISRAMMQRG